MKYALVRQGFIFCFLRGVFLLLFCLFPFFLRLAPLRFLFLESALFTKSLSFFPKRYLVFSSKLFEILDGDREDFAFISIFSADSFGSEERALETSSFGWLLAFPIVSSFKALVILATLFNEAPSMRFIGASCFWLYSKRESPLESFLREYGEIGFEG